MAIRYGDRGNPETAGKTLYECRVVKTYGREERIMSDVWAWVSYAVIWTEEERPKTIVCGNSEFPSGTEAKVDAPPEIAEKYAAWEEGVARAHKDYENERDYNRRLRTAMTPAKGKKVRIVKGRKVPRETIAEAIWYGRDKYNRYGHRVGLKVNGNENPVWINAENVEVVDPWRYYQEWR